MIVPQIGEMICSKIADHWLLYGGEQAEMATGDSGGAKHEKTLKLRCTEGKEWE